MIPTSLQQLYQVKTQDSFSSISLFLSFYFCDRAVIMLVCVQYTLKWYREITSVGNDLLVTLSNAI